MGSSSGLGTLRLVLGARLQVKVLVASGYWGQNECFCLLMLALAPGCFDTTISTATLNDAAEKPQEGFQGSKH